MKKLYIVGMGNAGAEALAFIQGYHLFEVAGFAVDKEYLSSREFRGYPVYTIDELDGIVDKENDLLFVAIFWNYLNRQRKDMFLRLKARGFHFANLISPNAVVASPINGENIWIQNFVIIKNDVAIADDVYVKNQALVGETAVLKAHCYIGARALVSGGSTIGEQSFVGLNATIFDDTQIGEKSIIGACTIIKRNVPPYHVVKTGTDVVVTKEYAPDAIEGKLVSAKNVR